MQANTISFSEILLFSAVLLIVIIWVVTAPRLKFPWIPSSNFSRLAVCGLVFLYFWNLFVAQTILLGEPLYFWYGLLLVLGVLAHWARISRQEPASKPE